MNFRKIQTFITLTPALVLCACDAGITSDEIATPPTADAAPELGPKDSIDLQAGGLAVPAQDGDEVLEVPFGSMRAAAEATLADVLGEVVSRTENAECGAGPLQLTQYNGLTLNFQDGRLVGWFARDPYLPTALRDELLAGDGIVMVPESTLGEEFEIGDPPGAAISGVFASEDSDAKVTGLWAGTNCLFR